MGFINVKKTIIRSLIALSAFVSINSQACDYVLEMLDSYGDGWDGSTIDLYISGNYQNTYTVTGSSLTVTLNVATGQTIELFYTDGGGLWESEVSWNLYNSSGAVVASDYGPPYEGWVADVTVDCAGGGSSVATAGDCADAINVCTDLGFTIDPNGIGLINEIPASGTYGNPLNNNPGGSGNSGCLQEGEKNSTWMIVNIAGDGNLEFNFGGSSQSNYYDWIMYPYDDNSCANIPAGLVAPVRCNWNASSSGGTGLDDNPSWLLGEDDGNFEPSLPVQCGERYIICFSNWGSAETDVPLQFSGTASVACGSPTCAGNAQCTSTPGDIQYQDCIGAIPVCQDYFCQEYSFVGTGNIPNEINSGPSCMDDGERNDSWYIFTVQQSGNLNFTIDPNEFTDDYDWAVYNLTYNTCADIYGNSALEVSCNWSADDGPTGATGGSTYSSQGASGSPFNAQVPVVVGETYVLNVSNYSSTTSGYELDFSASTAVIYDNIPPEIDYLDVTPSCGTSQLTFVFSEFVLCSSVQNCDFQLTGPGGPYTLSGVSGNACNIGGTNESTFTINVSPAITQSGNYSFNLVSGCGFVEDLCGNVAGPGSLPFTITAVTTTTSFVDPTCNSSCNGSASVSASGGILPYTYNWTSGSTNASATGLCAGTQTVTVTDNGGCSTTASVTITDPPALSLSLSSTPENCGQADGTIVATVTGGTPSYDFASTPAFDNANNTSSPYTFTGATASAYTVTVTDADNCTVTGPISVGSTGAVNAQFSYNGNQCWDDAGQNLVTFTNTSTGATTYSWDFDGNGTEDSNSSSPTVTWDYAAPGIYNATLTATQGGCSDVEIVIVTIYDLPAISFTVTPATCAGLCDGIVQVNASAGGAAGSGTFTHYYWSDGPDTDNRTDLCDGTYTVTVEDNVLCQSVATVTVTEPLPIVVTTSFTDETCNNGCNGTASVTNVTGGSGLANMSYSWNTGASTSSISSLCDGNYSVTVSDNNSSNCTVVENFTIGAGMTVTLTTSSVESNCGQPDGSATVNYTNVDAYSPYIYSWSNGSTSSSASTTNTISNLTSAAYTVTVTNTQGCTAVASVNVNDASGPSASIINPVNLDCYNECIGEATVTASGGTPPYTYDWGSGYGTVTTATGLCAGVVNVVVKDDANCTASASVTLTEPTQLTLIASGTNANCSTPGQGTATASNGTGPYTYSWTGGLTGSPVSLTVGTYTVTATDNNSCTTSQTITISDIGGLGASISATGSVSCNGGSDGTATATITSGGTAPFTYAWSNGITNTTGNVTGLSAGPVGVTITDVNGCGTSASSTVAEPSILQISITGSTMVSCNGLSDGTATALAIGGTTAYSYQWDGQTGNQTSATATGLQQSTYTVTVTDAELCTASTSVTITQPAAISVLATGDTAHCGQNDASAWVTSTTGGNAGGYSYAWTGGQNAQTASAISAGTYFVTATDSKGCTGTTSVYIPDVPAGTATIVAPQNVTCNGAANGQASVSFTGVYPFTYAWTNGQSTQTATGLSGGSYTVVVTDANGCTDDASVTINEPTALSFVFDMNQALCFGEDNGELTALASGGTTPYNYQWSNFMMGSQIIDGAGNYCVTITDGAGCTTYGCSDITEPNPIQVIDSINNASCGQNDGSVYLVASGGSGTLNYTWNIGPTTNFISGVYAGTYNVTVSDAKDCKVIQTYTVIDQSGPTIDIVDSMTVNVSCFGSSDGSAVATATGGVPPYSYNWSTSTSGYIASGLSSGTYTVTVTDANNCKSSTTVVISAPTLMQILPTLVNPKCFASTDGSVSLAVSGGVQPYDFQWSGAGASSDSSSYNNLGEGTYTVLVTDANGCSRNTSFDLYEPDPIVLTTGHVNATCASSGDGKVFVDTVYGGTPGSSYSYLYQWGANANYQITDTAFNLNPGTFCVTVTDGNGCTAFSCGSVTAPPGLLFQDVVSQNVNCYGGSTGNISVFMGGGVPPYQYLWESTSGSVVGTTQTISALQQGVYFLTVADVNGCWIDSLFSVTQPPQLIFSVNDVTLECYGDCDGALDLNIVGTNVGTPPYNYIWTNTATTQDLSSLCSGSYSVTVSDANNCKFYATADVNQPQLLKIDTVLITDAACGESNGCAKVVYNGGSVGYSIEWSTGGISILECGLAAGSYSVSVTDINGCLVDTTISISNLDGPTITNVMHTNVSCAGSADAAATLFYNPSLPDASPYTIQWSGGGSDSTITGLSGGDYWVQVSDANGCADFYNFTITEPTVLTTGINSFTSADCYGFCNGTASVLQNGGTPPYLYEWSNNQGTAYATGLCAGTYFVTVTDFHGCTNSTSIIIGQPNEIIVVPNIHDITCYDLNNGSISVTALGGSGIFDVYWPQYPTNQTNTISNLMPGTYTVVISEVTNPSCYVDTSFLLNEPEAMVPVISTTQTYCDFANGTATVVDVAGGSGAWYPIWNTPYSTEITVTGLAYGVFYPLQIFDMTDNDCYITEYVQVGRKIPPSITLVDRENPSCANRNDGWALIRVYNGEPPYYYDWNGFAGQTDTLAENLFDGMYTVTATDADMCTATGSFMLYDPAPVHVIAYAYPQTICYGDSSFIAAQGSGGHYPYEYLWSGPDVVPTLQNQFVSPTNYTPYTVVVTDANQCTSAPSIIPVMVREPLSIEAFAERNWLCKGDSVRLQAFAQGGLQPHTLYWSSGSIGDVTYVKPIQETEFYVIVFDSMFCSEPDTAYVSVDVVPTPPIRMTADHRKGCDPINVHFMNDTTLSNVNYEWNFGHASSGSLNSSYVQNPNHLYDSPGIYDVSLTVTDITYGCQSDYVWEEMIEVYDNPDADFMMQPDRADLFHADISFIDLSTSNVDYWIWDFGDAAYSMEQNPTHWYQRPDTFIVRLEVHTPHNCIDTATKPIVINPAYTLYVPSAFTPKPMGVETENAFFTPEGNGIGDCSECFEMYIYDRWGELIFSCDEFYGNNPSEENHWNGRIGNKGKIVEVGVYTYYILLTDIVGEKHTEIGSVTVIR